MNKRKVSKALPIGDIHLFILKYNEDEGVERWVNELIQTLKSKNIRCLKEDEYTVIGDNVYDSLERSINSSENVMVVITEGFLTKGYLTLRLHLALKQTVEKNIQFLPVLSDDIAIENIPFCLCTTTCLYVDFSKDLLQLDVDKIVKSLQLKGRNVTTVAELENILRIFSEAIDLATPQVLSDIQNVTLFKKVRSFFAGRGKRSFLKREENNKSTAVTIRRAASDTSDMRSLKRLRAGDNSKYKTNNAKPCRSHSFGHRYDFSNKRVLVNLDPL